MLQTAELYEAIYLCTRRLWRLGWTKSYSWNAERDKCASCNFDYASQTQPRHAGINGAQAKNVVWHVGSSAARIENGSTMGRHIIANAGVTISTAGQTIHPPLTGRAIGLNASVSTVNTTILAP